MSDPILDLLAAPPNPSMSVDEPAVYAGGRRRLRRRRVLTAAGAAAAALAVAGTIGVLGPRVDDDALPALPTPTLTPTSEATPTVTPSATPSATVSPSATVTTPTSTPSATSSGTPSSTPTKTLPSPSSGLEWSDPVTVDGVSYRARLVWTGDGRTNYKAELRANGSLVYTHHDPNGEHSLWSKSDPRVIYAAFVGPLSDVISENSEPVSGEEFKSITLPFPDTGAEYPKGAFTITIIKLPRAAALDLNNNVVDMVVRTAAGKEITYCVGYCSPE